MDDEPHVESAVQALRPPRLGLANLSDNDRRERRRAGNRAAAGRLRERRLQATKELEAKCKTLEAEKALHRGQMLELLAYCKAVMTDNHCIATQLVSLGVAVPSIPSLGNVTVAPPTALTAALRDHSVVQERSGVSSSSGGVLSGVAVPTNMSTGSLGSFVESRSSEAAMPEGAMSWALGPTVPPVVPSMSSTASPLDNMFDLLMTASPAARQPSSPGLPPVTERLPGLGPAAEARALPPSLPTLSEHVAELMSGAMLGSQEDWLGFPQLQRLRHPVVSSFDTVDMSTPSIGQSPS